MTYCEITPSNSVAMDQAYLITALRKAEVSGLNLSAA
jgi:hypothetical protein